jgi:hypothetical protein
MRRRHPGHRSACTGCDNHIVISQAVASRDGHDARFAPGSDNPRGVPHMTTLDTTTTCLPDLRPECYTGAATSLS